MADGSIPLLLRARSKESMANVQMKYWQLDDVDNRTTVVGCTGPVQVLCNTTHLTFRLSAAPNSMIKPRPTINFF